MRKDFVASRGDIIQILANYTHVHIYTFRYILHTLSCLYVLSKQQLCTQPQPEIVNEGYYSCVIVAPDSDIFGPRTLSLISTGHGNGVPVRYGLLSPLKGSGDQE